MRRCCIESGLQGGGRANEGRQSTFLTIAEPARITAATVTPSRAFCRHKRFVRPSHAANRRQAAITPLARFLSVNRPDTAISRCLGAAGKRSQTPGCPSGAPKPAPRTPSTHSCSVPEGPKTSGVARLAAEGHPLTSSAPQMASERQVQPLIVTTRARELHEAEPRQMSDPEGVRHGRRRSPSASP